MFQKGHKFGKGGPRKGSGRPPNFIRERLKDIANHPKALKFLEDAILGEAVDAKIHEGQVIKGPAGAQVRAAIWESVHDRGFGKPVSVLELPDGSKAVGFPVIILPAKEGGKKGKASA